VVFLLYKSGPAGFNASSGARRPPAAQQGAEVRAIDESVSGDVALAAVSTPFAQQGGEIRAVDDAVSGEVSSAADGVCVFIRNPICAQERCS
jgi:hypothetical protein